MTEKNPTIFDATGAFNDFHNKDKKPTSFALSLDVGRSIPKVSIICLITKNLQDFRCCSDTLKL